MSAHEKNPIEWETKIEAQQIVYDSIRFVRDFLRSIRILFPRIPLVSQAVVNVIFEEHHNESSLWLGLFHETFQLTISTLIIKNKIIKDVELKSI